MHTKPKQLHPSTVSAALAALACVSTLALSAAGCMPARSHLGVQAGSLMKPADPASPDSLVTGFDRYCDQVGGSLLLSGTARPVCKWITLPLASRSGSEALSLSWEGESFPRLGEAEPANPRAYDVPVIVRAGDRLVFEARGGWGWTDGAADEERCRQYNLDGSPAEAGSGEAEDGSAHSNGRGRPMEHALLASDGQHVYGLGNRAKLIFRSTGALSFGFNSEEKQGQCGSLEILRFEIHHCEDADGRTVICPDAAVVGRREF